LGKFLFFGIRCHAALSFIYFQTVDIFVDRCHVNRCHVNCHVNRCQVRCHLPVVKLGAMIRFVKLGAKLILVMCPAYSNLYVKKYFLALEFISRDGR